MLTWADSDIVMATAALPALSQTGQAAESSRRTATLPGSGGWTRAGVTLWPLWPWAPWTMNCKREETENKKIKNKKN